MISRTALPRAAFAATLIVNALFLNFNAFRTFYFLDAGPFLYASWKVFNGELPYADFILKCGPIYFYVNAFFFHLFGFGKIAVLAHLVTTSSVVILCAYLICARHRLPLYATIAALCLTMTSFYWSFSFPWYNQLSHFWGIIGVTCLLLQMPFQSNRRAWLTGAACGALAVMSFMTKFNTGGAYGVVFFAVLALAANRWRALAGMILGALISTLIVAFLFIHDVPEFLKQALGLISFTYTKTGRVQLLGTLHVWLTNHYVYVAAIVLLGLWKNFTQKKELLLLFFGLWFVGIFATYTSTIVHEQDVQLLGIYVTLAFVLLYRLPDGWLRRVSAVLLLALTLFLTALHGRYGFEIKGWAFPDTVNTFPGDKINIVGDYALKVPELRGWLCNRDKGVAVDELTDFIKQNVRTDDSLLVLTDLQILYPLTGRDSYKLTPPFWGIPVAPAPGEEMEEFRKGFRENPPLWIVTHKRKIAHLNDLISYLDLEGDIVSAYIIAKESGPYIMLRRVK